MNGKDLRRNGAPKELLTTLEALERLFRMMAAWWEGRSLASVAREFGVSRQRASALLAGVNCTAAARRRARRRQPDSGRQAAMRRVVEARQALLHPLAGRLTPRQRCALAWQAQGLALTDISRRMGITAQGVQQHLVGARWRLERLSLRQADGGADANPPDIGDVDYTGIFEGLAIDEPVGGAP